MPCNITTAYPHPHTHTRTHMQTERHTHTHTHPTEAGRRLKAPAADASRVRGKTLECMGQASSVVAGLTDSCENKMFKNSGQDHCPGPLEVSAVVGSVISVTNELGFMLRGRG